MDNAPAHEHEQKETFTIDVYLPDHPDRTTSPVFRATRKKLIVDNPHARCEVNNEECDLTHPLELHHDLVEWADANGVDWAKMQALCPEFNWAAFNPARPETFIDSEFNAKRILCKRHHTGADRGIHMLPYPIWRMQLVKRDDFVFAPGDKVKAHA